MKFKITFLWVIAMFIISCTTKDPSENENLNLITIPGQLDDGISGDPTDTVLYDDDLMAGQNMDAGGVTVALVDGNVVVTYDTSEGDWTIDEVHLFKGDLGDLPTTGNGNPKIGHFPYSGSYGSGTTNVSFTGLELTEGECVFIAAHAVVTNTATGQSETAWAAGIPMGGNNWAMMFEVCN